MMGETKEEVRSQVVRSVAMALLQSGHVQLAGQVARASKAGNAQVLRLVERATIREELPRWITTGIAILENAV